jgi:DNA-binding CsgD family transcriptional regulator
MDRTDVAAGTPVAPSAFSAPRHTASLVGRAREQIILHEELAAIRAGHGRLVVLGGEAGMGKTSLARSLAQEARHHNVQVLLGHGYDLNQAPPYGPWLDLFATYTPSARHPEPPPALANGILADITDQAALVGQVRSFFTSLCAVQPALVLLEDLHWADAASVDLLRQVAPHLMHRPICFLLTYREEALTRRHPLAHQLPALVRETDGVRIALRRLDPAALQRLIRDRYTLSASDETRLVTYLDRHAEGNPFFATELLRALEDETFLQQDGNVWWLGALDRVIVPTFLRQVIDARVARLGETLRQPLELAAVIGQDVPLELWVKLAGLDEEAVLTIVERAVEVHLLVAERAGTHVRFVHALTRDALYDGIVAPRRRRWHRQIAEILMTAEPPDVEAVAAHLHHAGDPRAWEWLVQAADRAQRAYAWLTAAERLQLAADLLARVPGRERTRGQLLYRLARLQRFSDSVSAITSVDECSRIAIQSDDAILAAEAAYHRGTVRCYADHFASGLVEMAAGIAALEAMPLAATRAFPLTEPWLADALPSMTAGDSTSDDAAAAELHLAGLHYRRGAYPYFLATAGQLEEAQVIGTRILDVLATAPGSRKGIGTVAGFCNVGLGTVAASRGDPARATQAFSLARERFRDIDHHTLEAFTWLLELRDVVLPFATDVPATRRHVAGEAEAALARAGGALRPGLSPKVAWLSCLVLDGRWDEALQILCDLPTPGNAFLRREVTSATVLLARYRGEPDLAWEQITALLPQGSETAPGDIIHQEGLALLRLAAELCLDTGDLPGAGRWLAAHERWLAWSGSVLGRADGLLVQARFAALDHDPAAAKAMALEAQAGARLQPLARMAALRLLGELATAEGDFGTAASHLKAARELANRCEVPFELALALLALAELRGAQGAISEAASLINDVQIRCAALEATPTLDRAATLAGRHSTGLSSTSVSAGLTQRELDVLRLLMQRQTDKEIAESLFLGHRTIQSHVTHILAKLGVTNRREAAREAERLGIV